MWTNHARISAITAGVVLLLICSVTDSFARGSSGGHDDPLNSDRIDRLPPEIRTAVIRMCRDPPRASHYFATYIDNSHVVKLHFEGLRCKGQATFCREYACLRQEYVSTRGHYQLKKSYYGHNGD